MEELQKAEDEVRDTVTKLLEKAFKDDNYGAPDIGIDEVSLEVSIKLYVEDQDGNPSKNRQEYADVFSDLNPLSPPDKLSTGPNGMIYAKWRLRH